MLETLSSRMTRLAVLVGRDLDAADPDGLRERERQLMRTHRDELAKSQRDLEEARTGRRRSEDAALLADEEVQAVRKDRDSAVAECQQLRDLLRTCRETVADLSSGRDDAIQRAAASASAAARATQQLDAQAHFLGAAERRLREVLAERDAITTELRAHQLRTAELFADAERRAADSLRSALDTADRRAVRDRRAAERGLKEAFDHERRRLQDEINLLRAERGPSARTPPSVPEGLPAAVRCI